MLERVLPLVARHKAAVVAISNDETGISEDPDVRFAVAKKIVERAADHGIPYSDVVVDPLVMPIGAINSAGVQVMALVRRLRDELKVNTTCGASNVSFGLPNRNGINSAFLTMAMGAGMTSAITSPLHPEVMQAVRGDVMLGMTRIAPAGFGPTGNPLPRAPVAAVVAVGPAAAGEPDPGRRRRHCPVHALGQTGAFAPGTPLLEAARSWASISIQSAAAAACVAAAGQLRQRLICQTPDRIRR